MNVDIDKWLEEERQRLAEKARAESSDWAKLSEAARPVVRGAYRRRRSSAMRRQLNTLVAVVWVILLAAAAAMAVALVASSIATQVNHVMITGDEIRQAVAW